MEGCKLDKVQDYFESEFHDVIDNDDVWDDCFQYAWAGSSARAAQLYREESIIPYCEANN